MFDTKFGTRNETQIIAVLPMGYRRSEEETVEGDLLDRPTRASLAHRAGMVLYFAALETFL